MLHWALIGPTARSAARQIQGPGQIRANGGRTIRRRLLPRQPTPRAAPANTPPPPGWAARCGSAGRDAPLECAIEQSAVLPRTGQLVILVNIRVPADTHTPSALIQLPLGLNLPAGAKLQVDQGKTTDSRSRTAKQTAPTPNWSIAPDLLAAPNPASS